MIIRRSKRMFLNWPARRKDDEIGNSRAWFQWRTGQHCKDGWILQGWRRIWLRCKCLQGDTYHVINRHGIHDDKFAKVVLVWGVISMPSDDIETGMILKTSIQMWRKAIARRVRQYLSGLKETPLVFVHDGKIRFTIFVPSWRKRKGWSSIKSIPNLPVGVSKSRGLAKPLAPRWK